MTARFDGFNRQSSPRLAKCDIDFKNEESISRNAEFEAERMNVHKTIGYHWNRLEKTILMVSRISFWDQI
jgi:hypothetical protein